MTGLLWHDAEGTWQDRVGRAVVRYQEKHGEVPTTCYVNPNDTDLTEAGDLLVGEVKVSVVPYSSVLRNHFWVVKS